MVGNSPQKFDAEDHDALVTLMSDMKYLCESVKEIKRMQKEQTDSCNCRMRECVRFFVPSKVFYTALGIICVVLGTLSVMTYQLREDLAVQKIKVESKIESRTTEVDIN